MCPQQLLEQEMVAGCRKLLLRVPAGQPHTRFPHTRFACIFADEALRHIIPVGLDLAAMGTHNMLCEDPGQLQPHSHIHLLAAGTPHADAQPEDLA